MGKDGDGYTLESKFESSHCSGRCSTRQRGFYLLLNLQSRVRVMACITGSSGRLCARVEKLCQQSGRFVHFCTRKITTTGVNEKLHQQVQPISLVQSCRVSYYIFSIDQ